MRVMQRSMFIDSVNQCSFFFFFFVSSLSGDH